LKLSGKGGTGGTEEPSLLWVQVYVFPLQRSAAILAPPKIRRLTPKRKPFPEKAPAKREYGGSFSKKHQRPVKDPEELILRVLRQKVLFQKSSPLKSLTYPKRAPPELPKILSQIHGLKIRSAGTPVKMKRTPNQGLRKGSSDFSSSRSGRKNPKSSLLSAPNIKSSEGRREILSIEHHSGNPKLSLMFHEIEICLSPKNQRSLS
jgi:hypothetical protein